MSLITIGIPTYRRDQEVIQVLTRAKEQDVLLDFGLIVIDDGPSDSLEDIVSQTFPSVIFYRHDKNMGFARSFVDLLNRCPTAYLMITADDDFLLHSGLRGAEKYLENNECDLLSTQWLRNGKIHRGRSSILPIGYSELRPATNHAPGLIFNVESALRHASVLNRLLDAGNYAARTYPQVVLAYLMLMEGGVLRWHDSAPVSEGFVAPSQFTDSAGNGYWSLAGRVQEHLGFSEFFQMCATELSSSSGRQLASQLTTFQEQELYKLIEACISTDMKGRGLNFRGAALFYNLRSPIKACFELLSWVRNRQRAHKIAAKSQADLVSTTRVASEAEME